MSHDADQPIITPLTHVAGDGTPYRRPEAVEAQIASALRMAPAAYLVRAQITEAGDPAYLGEEALVYLLRSAHAAGDAATVAALWPVLLSRCLPLFKRRLGSLGVQGFQEACDECASDLAVSIFDLSSDRGDFLQVRFWVVLKRLAITTFDRYCAAHARQESTMPIDDERPAQGDEGSLPNGMVIDDPTLGPDQLAELRDALASIPEPARTAFVLRHYHRWPIEDRDPTVPTISRHLNRTGRTVRTYLTTAEEALVAWRRGDQR